MKIMPAFGVTQQQRQLFIDERGTSGDLTEIFIRCECGKAERSVAQAARFRISRCLFPKAATTLRYLD